MKLEYYLVTDVGNSRQNNEDNFCIGKDIRTDVIESHVECNGKVKNSVFMAGVFDGMGGESRGEEASLIAARTLQEYQKASFYAIKNQYVQDANTRICRKMQDESNMRMGSTLAIAYIKEGQLSICNLGDSPIFLFRENGLQQLTVPHNEAQRMVNLGLMTLEEAKTSNQKHSLTQHLGIMEDEMLLEPYVREDIPLERNDEVLLCSDGLTDMVPEEDIVKVLKTNATVKEKTRTLVKLALANGGYDNVTVMLIHVCRE